MRKASCKDFSIEALKPPLDAEIKIHGGIYLWVQLPELVAIGNDYARSIGYPFQSIESAKAWFYYFRGEEDKWIEADFQVNVKRIGGAK